MNHLKPQKLIPYGSAHFRLPLPILQKLDTYCQAIDITRSQLIRRLIANYEPLKQMPDGQEPGPAPQHYPGWLVSGKA